MPCLNNYTLRGLHNDCLSNFAGIAELYLTYIDAITPETDPTTHTVTGYTIDGPLFKYDFTENAASFTSTLVKDDSTGSRYYIHSIEARFDRLEAESHLEMESIVAERLAAIVVDNNGRKWYFGVDGYLTGVENEAGTGIAIDDQQGYSVTIEGTFETLPWRFTGDETDPDLGDYLTIEGVDSTTTVNITPNGYEFEMRKNKGSWETATGVVYLDSGDILEFRGDNDYYAYNYSGANIRATGGSSIIYGNIMSLIDSRNFHYLNTFPEDSTYNFYGLFRNSSSITDASGLKLPVMALTQGCYQNLFTYCTSLTGTPVLPATTIVICCYEGMFEGCSSLTTAPNMPGRNAAKYCYKRMFANCGSLRYNIPTVLPGSLAYYGCFYEMFLNCTSLTTAPALPATEIHGSAYFEMFRGCTSLTTAPALPATILTYGDDDMGEETTGITQYEGMFSGCTSLTTAQETLPAPGPLPGNCYSHMFQNCTSLTTAPILPAAEKGSFSYGEMFAGCTNLNYVKCLATDDGNARDWLNGVAETGTFVKDADTTWGSGPSGIPDGWTIVDNE